jgi:hypothetical protein
MVGNMFPTGKQFAAMGCAVLAFGAVLGIALLYAWAWLSSHLEINLEWIP